MSLVGCGCGMFVYLAVLAITFSLFVHMQIRHPPLFHGPSKPPPPVTLMAQVNHHHHHSDVQVNPHTATLTTHLPLNITRSESQSLQTRLLLLHIQLTTYKNGPPSTPPSPVLSIHDEVNARPYSYNPSSPLPAPSPNGAPEPATIGGTTSFPFPLTSLTPFT